MNQSEFKWDLQLFASDNPDAPLSGDPPATPSSGTNPAGVPPGNPPAASLPNGDSPINNPSAANPPVTGAPEKYGDFILPQGMTANPEFIGKASVKFKEANLTQEQAQTFVNLYADHMQSLNKNFEELKNGWKEQTIKDLGPKYQEEMAFGAKFKDQFLSSETVNFLDKNGLLDHPLIVKDFIKAGKSLAEDNLVPGTGKGGNQTLADRIYGN